MTITLPPATATRRHIRLDLPTTTDSVVIELALVHDKDHKKYKASLFVVTLRREPCGGAMRGYDLRAKHTYLTLESTPRYNEKRLNELYTQLPALADFQDALQKVLTDNTLTLKEN